MTRFIGATLALEPPESERPEQPPPPSMRRSVMPGGMT
jgi:hypothetical protein